ncbi:LPS export ABC transporter permease LptF [Labrys wisconsinensis]|uniref:Lipopolysaccharide export system permease protein n=1 Tax=Labrys wisconsinensis TaxID=425677 RepID=A0ABU0J229_9HYPH|nr:LPS export ABC transporter permease LptF [Labrys wisconsinensis]MDQ0468312.1 lipopolysaccharide export system permease protein [Labrys wisconsinensis]
MRLIDRYIFRHLTVAFLACLLALTALIWLTQALRDFDLVTAQGQTVLIFLTISSLALPSLVVIIAPVALFIAIVWILNRLNGDSELVVMSAAGLSPTRLARPFMVLTLVVAVAIGVVTTYAQPASLRELRYWLTQVRADLISKIVREGQFTTVAGGITFHIRERRPNGALLGIFVQDARAKDQTLTYIAERGQIVDSATGMLLVLDKGSVQRQLAGGASDASIVVFERYAFDLSQLVDDPDVTRYKPRELYTSELWDPDTTDPQYAANVGRFRSELVERFVAPLYPVAFMLVALAALGQARTTRQSRSAAVALAIVVIVVVRIAGFAGQTWSARSPTGAVAPFAVLVVTSLVALAVILGWARPHLPQAMARLGADLLARIPGARRADVRP